MKTKLLTTSVLFLIAFVTNIAGQSIHREGEYQRDTLITLLQKNDFTKTVILLQTDKYIIKTSLSNLKENMDNWILQNPQLKDDKELLKLILEGSNNNKEVDVEKIARKNNLVSSLQYRIAAILENSKCYIINQADGKLINAIRVQTYYLGFCPLCEEGGRRFFINDILLLHVIDWVS